MANKGENGNKEWKFLPPPNHPIILSLPLWGIPPWTTRHPLPQETKRGYAFSKYTKLSFAVRPRTNLWKGKTNASRPATKKREETAMERWDKRGAHSHCLPIIVPALDSLNWFSLQFNSPVKLLSSHEEMDLVNFRKLFAHHWKRSPQWWETMPQMILHMSRSTGRLKCPLLYMMDLLIWGYRSPRGRVGPLENGSPVPTIRL